MSNKTNGLALLPSGFEDVLPPMAEREARAISKLMRLFSEFGYQRVKPPMAEFEQTMLGDGPGAALARDTFRMMDPVSHEMLALRSDITAQMARIAGSRLAEAARPLRLSYANDVIRTRAGQQRTLRQFAQVGCELIGADSVSADAEAAILAMLSLHEMGVQGASIDFAAPRLIDVICEAESLKEHQAEAVKAALRSRDEAGVHAAGGKVAKIFSALLKVSGPADQALAGLKKIKFPKEAGAVIKRLEGVVHEVQKASLELGLGDIALTIDPVETKGFDYHQGVAFTLFAKNARGELGRGGRYGVNGETAEATGFTLYMDALRRVIPLEEAPRFLYIPKPESWTLVKNLQNEGWRIVRGAGEKMPPSGCTHIYKNGKIEEIKA